jgi:hypothetical protein
MTHTYIDILLAPDKSNILGYVAAAPQRASRSPKISSHHIGGLSGHPLLGVWVAVAAAAVAQGSKAPGLGALAHIAR